MIMVNFHSDAQLPCYFHYLYRFSTSTTTFVSLKNSKKLKISKKKNLNFENEKKGLNFKIKKNS